MLLCAVGQSPGDSYVDMSIAFQRLTHASLVNQRLSSAGSCILGYLTTGSFGNSSIKSVLASDLSIPFQRLDDRCCSCSSSCRSVGHHATKKPTSVISMHLILSLLLLYLSCQGVGKWSVHWFLLISFPMLRSQWRFLRSWLKRGSSGRC